MRKKSIDFYKELTSPVNWKLVYVTMVTIGLFGFIFGIINRENVLFYALIGPACILLAIYFGCIKHYLQKRLTKNEAKAEIVTDPEKKFIIKNIKRGYSCFQSNFLYAELYLIDDGLVSNNRLDIMLEMYFDQQHKIENYKNCFEQLIKHYNDVLLGKI